MHLVALGKREAFACETPEALAKCAVPAKPARSHCAWPDAGSPAGCVRAGRGHFGRNGLPQSERRPGGFADTKQSRPSAGSPCNLRSSKARPTPARRLFRLARACRLAVGDFRLFFEPLGDGLPGYPEDALGCSQPKSLDLHRPQDQRLALRVDGRAFGYQHPMRPAGFAKKLLRAAGVVTGFDEGHAAAGRAARNGGFHTHSSLRKPLLSLVSLPLPLNALTRVAAVDSRRRVPPASTVKAQAERLPTSVGFPSVSSSRREQDGHKPRRLHQSFGLCGKLAETAAAKSVRPSTGPSARQQPCRSRDQSRLGNRPLFDWKIHLSLS